MTTDLWMLAASAALQWILIMLAAMPRLASNGIRWGLWNRDTPSVDVPGWAVRTQRASDNLQENLVLFAILVLVVHASGTASGTSATGALVFFGARVAHAVVYMAGIPVARTLSWAVGIAGMGMVASALFAG